METVIKAQDISFSYGGEPILYNIGFSVNKGDFIAVTGANGSGKSTLMKLMLGEIQLQRGNIWLFGTEIRNFKHWPKIGYVPQNGTARAGGFPATALEIVRLNLYSNCGLMRFPTKALYKNADEALKLVGMQDYSKRLIGDMSGGQQQRVMIARVLAGEPELMLLDEPTTGIDAESAQSLYMLLSKLNRERKLTIIMITHDIARAADYVNRTLCLEEGSIVELMREQILTEQYHRHKHPQRSAENNDEHI
ncbi:MAG: metal ABC transporter ATP-binding protein [Bacillota bacterium]|nr:metal ABC transporter ATP-binding protein [Bacillota bacterium]